MTTNNTNTEPFEVGSVVKILNTGYGKGKIVEYRGPLGPRGSRIYRVRVRSKPKPAYIEVREDQLELVRSDSP